MPTLSFYCFVVRHCYLTKTYFLSGDIHVLPSVEYWSNWKGGKIYSDLFILWNYPSDTAAVRSSQSNHQAVVIIVHVFFASSVSI